MIKKERMSRANATLNTIIFLSLSSLKPHSHETQLELLLLLSKLMFVINILSSDISSYDD